MRGQRGTQHTAAAAQVGAGALVGMFSEPAALAVAEGVGQEERRVAVVGLEEQDVGARVAGLVTFHAEFQTRMDQRAEGLAQHHRQATVDQARNGLFGTAQHAVAAGMGGVKGYQRIQAQHQIQIHVQQHAGVQRLLQRTVHIPAAINGQRRKQARQRSAGGHGLGDGHMVPAGQAEGRRLAAVQIGGHQHQAALQLPEVVAAAGAAEQAAHLALQRCVAEQARGQGTAQVFQ